MDKESVHRRLTQAVDYLKDKGKARNQAEISALTGVLQPHVSSALKGNPNRLSKQFIHKFATAYSDYINEQWLLTGEGQMVVADKAMRPHVSAKASAGFMDNLSEADYGDDTRPLISGMPHYTFTINAKGDSMLPRIEDGDTLLCRKLTDRLNPPIGKICVLDTKDGWVVKVIKGVTEDTMTLHSLNPDYRDYDIDLNTILGIAQVVGLVREF